MKIQNRKLIGGLAVLCFVLLLLIALPLKIRETDKEAAVSRALAALLSGKRVLNSRGFVPLDSCDNLRNKTRVYFKNETGVPDALFLAQGLRPLAKGPNGLGFLILIKNNI